MGKKFYAVAKGRQIGIFTKWDEVQPLVNNFCGAKYKGFETKEQAQEFIDEFSDGKNIAYKRPPVSVASGAASIGHKIDISREELLDLKASFESMRPNLTQMLEKIEENTAKINAILNASNSTTDTGKRSLNESGEAKAEPEQPPGKRPRNTPTASTAASTVASKTTNENGFTLDDEGFVTVYTDGSCENNGRPNARAGYGVWWADGHPLNRGEAAGKPTNNAAEIEGATQAVIIASKQNVKKLKIFTDSKFLITCITQWMHGWKRNGWRTAKNEPVKNRAELEDLDRALNSGNIKVTWEHVRGHQGIYGNERADELARQGAMKYAQKNSNGHL